MISRYSFLPVLLALSACAAERTTTQSWSCRAVGNAACAPIAQIDEATASDHADVERRSEPGARLAAWWHPAQPLVVTREDAPRRENDQTMRIVLAPYIDGAGDYHDRSVIYAVMRKGQWWVAPPVPVVASPEPGSTLPPPDAGASVPDGK